MRYNSKTSNISSSLWLMQTFWPLKMDPYFGFQNHQLSLNHQIQASPRCLETGNKLTCLSRSDFCANCLPHWKHLCGLYPVWVRTCRSKSDFCMKALGHSIKSKTNWNLTMILEMQNYRITYNHKYKITKKQTERENPNYSQFVCL